jgi:putative MATE family efflux protein
MSQHTLRTENLFKLSWPVFLQNMTNTVVFMVDFLFFSYLSDEVAGTIGQILPIVWMGAFVIPVFAGTGVSVASQYMGAGQHDKVVPSYMMNLTFTFVMGIVYGSAMVFLAGDIGLWMGMDAHLNAISTEFFSTMAAYFFFMGIWVAYNAVLSSRGMTHWLMYTSFMVGAVNLVLDTVFVLGFGWGVRGIVLASVIGVASAMFVSMWMVHRKLGIRFYLKGAVNDMLSVLKPMLRIGIPNALEPFSYTVQQTILSTFIIAMGVTSMAANSYSGRAQMFQITFAFSLASGGQILFAHWMGARRFDDVNQLYWKAIRTAMTVAAVYATGLWLLSDWAMGVFTSDPEIKRIAKTLLFIAVFMEPARTVNIIGGFALRTVGDTRFPLIIAVIFIWGILPIIIFFDRTWGITLAGLWVCFAIDEILRAVINMWRWKTGRWKSMGIAHPKSIPGQPAPRDAATAV